MFLINGHKQESLAVSDRATQFGDGCFTTARVIDGKVSLLSAHIQRLQDACQRLMISCDFWPQLEQEMKTLADITAQIAQQPRIAKKRFIDTLLSLKLPAALNPFDTALISCAWG